MPMFSWLLVLFYAVVPGSGLVLAFVGLRKLVRLCRQNWEDRQIYPLRLGPNLTGKDRSFTDGWTTLIGPFGNHARLLLHFCIHGVPAEEIINTLYQLRSGEFGDLRSAISERMDDPELLIEADRLAEASDQDERRACTERLGTLMVDIVEGVINRGDGYEGYNFGPRLRVGIQLATPTEYQRELKRSR